MRQTPTWRRNLHKSDHDGLRNNVERDEVGEEVLVGARKGVRVRVRAGITGGTKGRVTNGVRTGVRVRTRGG